MSIPLQFWDYEQIENVIQEVLHLLARRVRE